MRTIDDHVQALVSGKLTARALIESCLSRIEDPAGEGARVFIRTDAASARAMADATDQLRRAGRAPSRYAGIPLALKDLFDVAGEPTPAGSVVLADAPPARAHATVVQRLLGLGFIPIGRANMTEFAYSGLGLNPHHGTPSSPWDRASRRIPGGSSSGSGVAIADGMALAALGTDTGGSCRIPAAFNGIVGYKPTARRVPIDGVLPLSPSLDSVGPLAPSVACCATVDAIISGAQPNPIAAVDLSGLRLAIPDNFGFDGIDAIVAATFDRAVARLSAAGARVVRRKFAVFDEIPQVNAGGGFTTAEAYAWHRPLLATKGTGYDPRVRARIERGQRQTAADYIDLLAARRRLIAEFDSSTQGYDAILLPTVPIIAPRIADLDHEADYLRTNMLILRNSAVGNFLDRCAISLPCHRAGDAPVGLMLMGETMGDQRLFAIAAAVETALST